MNRSAQSNTRSTRCRAMRRALTGVGLSAVLAGCAPVTDTATRGAFSEPALLHTQSNPPPGARVDACWGKAVTPAQIETTTHQVMLQPAEIRSDGRVTAPAVYKTETIQQITKARRELWFETPCPPELTVEFISSVQRALQVRDFYRGPITGYLDTRTERAIRKYQAPQGLDSDILSLAAARKLGLYAYGRPDA